MNKLERCLAALDGREPDHIPTFSMLFDPKPIDDALGRPHFPVWKLIQSPFMQKLVDRTAWLFNALAHANLGGAVFFSDALRADMKMGFDAGLATYYGGLRLIDHKELQDLAGRTYSLCDDGFGGIYAMYRGGLIGNPESWASFRKVDPQKYSRGARLYFSFLNMMWGGRIAIAAGLGQSLHQDITEGMGFKDFVYWSRKDPGFVREIVAWKTEVIVETVRAVGLSGVKMIWLGDDLAYRSGPMLSPKMLEGFFGESYKAIADAAHAGGCRIMFHTCGNVLDLLEMIADWGYDGVQALEPTAGVTIGEARKRIGDRLCLVGNIDITHTLVDASREEVFSEVRRCIEEGKGGGYMVSATNTHSALNHRNLTWMVEAAREYS